MSRPMTGMLARMIPASMAYQRTKIDPPASGVGAVLVMPMVNAFEIQAFHAQRTRYARAAFARTACVATRIVTERANRARKQRQASPMELVGPFSPSPTQRMSAFMVYAMGLGNASMSFSSARRMPIVRRVFAWMVIAAIHPAPNHAWRATSPITLVHVPLSPYTMTIPTRHLPVPGLKLLVMGAAFAREKLDKRASRMQIA